MISELCTVPSAVLHEPSQIQPGLAPAGSLTLPEGGWPPRSKVRRGLSCCPLGRFWRKSCCLGRGCRFEKTNKVNEGRGGNGLFREHGRPAGVGAENASLTRPRAVLGAGTSALVWGFLGWRVGAASLPQITPHDFPEIVL